MANGYNGYNGDNGASTSRKLLTGSSAGAAGLFGWLLIEFYNFQGKVESLIESREAETVQYMARLDAIQDEIEDVRRIMTAIDNRNRELVFILRGKVPHSGPDKGP